MPGARLVDKFVFISGEEGNYPTAWMCRMLQVARSSYYEWKIRGTGPNSWAQRRQALGGRVREVFDAHRGFAGARKIRGVLALAGWACSVKLVGRIMREQGLTAKWRKTRRVTTTVPAASDHREGICDLTAGNFHPDAYQPGKALVGDITYIRTPTGWLYLATTIDLATRKVLGWKVDRHMRASLVVSALENALANGVGPGAFFRSDHGTQYASQEMRTFCARHGITQSMGRAGICYDNAVAEAFFSHFKQEFSQAHTPGSDLATRHQIAAWINHYNQHRAHATLDYHTPQAIWEHKTQTT
ncbi:IS3 family transposase [Buchananella hordeovulneris]|uniref:IS3 family transposase n=1 Tax=Buchananella hordeovulneris TaxID=52770 RepID=UPI000F5E646D|nr:IS3 family transposase [Buchananella hordeovulneris]RRD53313.1 IS3 family transposase [Buchananella hordeovulneris]